MFLGLGLGWQLEKVNRASTMRMRLPVWTSEAVESSAAPAL